jgi:secretion/DNA translocation related TadE-like protein
VTGPGQRGSVTVVTAALLLVVFMFAVLVADAGKLLMAVGRAQTAADAAALAAAQELAIPSGASLVALAASFAAANGAEVVACSCPSGPGEVTLTVRLPVSGLVILTGRAVQATARAVVDLPAVAG